MSDISDLESRISAAMDRIGRGLETLAAPASDENLSTDLHAELEVEKVANAQLEERAKTLSGRIEEVEAELASAKDAVEKAVEAREAVEADLVAAREAAEAAENEKIEDEEVDGAEDTDAGDGELDVIDLDESRDAIAQLSARLRRMRRTSRLVRGTIQVLREAAEDEIKDPSLINQAMAAELEDIKAMRAAEIAEMDVIIGALRPMLEAGDASDVAPAIEGEA